MSLIEKWLEAELNAGKTQRKAMDDMNRALGTKVDHTQIFRWKAGAASADDPNGRSPRPLVREYMLRIAVPYVLKGLKKKDIDLVVESFR